MQQQDIINAVEGSIKSVGDLFEKEPTRFFTENDLVCSFHRFLFNSLEDLGADTVPDKDDLPHSLIHCEYATVFRCDMKNKGFLPKVDTDKTTKNGKFRRGHHDIVVLNPTFIKNNNFVALKGQTYEHIKQLHSKCTEAEPAFLYGVELVYKRDPLTDAAVRRFLNEIKQDAAKLEESIKDQKVMRNARMLVFIKGTSAEVLKVLEDSLQNEKLITLVSAKEPAPNAHTRLPSVHVAGA